MSLKILTVDDSKTIRMIMAKALRPYDCTVLEAANGVIGLAVATREKPDLIILDYTMPVMDGFEVLARLRSDSELKATPVIMLTAEAGRETVIKIAKLGVRDYLIKPFKEDLLVERVGRVVQLKLKSEDVAKTKRFDDPINILVVDDKPAIPQLIRTAIGDTPWNVFSTEQTTEVIDACVKQKADVVLVSLSLPKDNAYVLFQNLRGVAACASVPVFGMCVRTAVSEQARAQQAGFAGIITKPIESEELKTKIARALHLEISYKYFQQRDNTLVLTMPKEVPQNVAREVSSRLDEQITGVVEAGGDKMIIDLSSTEEASLALIQLILSAITACSKLSLRYAIVGSDAIKSECSSFEEAQKWSFAKDMNEAMAFLN